MNSFRIESRLENLRLSETELDLFDMSEPPSSESSASVASKSDSVTDITLLRPLNLSSVVFYKEF